MSKIEPKKKIKEEKIEEVKTKSFIEKIASKEWRNFLANLAIVLVIIISVNKFISYCHIENHVNDFLINTLVIGSLLAAFLHGRHNWHRNAIWFLFFVVLLISVGGLDRLEKQRKPGIKLHVIQKTYNWFVNPKPVQASIRPTAKDYKVYKPNDIVVFQLAKGEYSDHWVRPGRETGYQLQSKYGDYEIHYRDGRKFKKGEKLPQRIAEDFKIYAIEKCDMRILFLHPNQIH